MNRLTGLFFCVSLLFGASWLGLVAYPYLTFAGLRQSKDEATGALAPLGVPGTATQGARIYAANGCLYCHSQYIRAKDEGSDIDRKWATRRTVARDYMFDRQVFLGVSRLGADLTNVGVRQTDPQWFYRILYSPQTVSPETSMPAYRWLFVTREIQGQPSADAVKLEGRDAPPPGYEIVPTDEGKALVEYLLSLKRNYPLPEAPEATE
ncbi:MAG: cbb3-type cytochrome c oxidase subunit II [Verrucomicrobia bacterium]|nr:cbb3-type cytochrome c oxidase subunit II [Verrucomicrobiota bacterium]MBV9298399.1 cbb3-type cytochrome c oxidase subunit II [Verrucomicrobiota bacterium]MBV9642097.1 cbb3-type cytochrome c oxidase subunit II [Verrucomicrobiota bacterium]